jgi:hypothetical protein
MTSNSKSAEQIAREIVEAELSDELVSSGYASPKVKRGKQASPGVRVQADPRNPTLVF